jgi:predicted RNA-binding Zn-ribbon protein involved in translation (DUF1610 family)
MKTRIKWAPKVRMEQISRLYRAEAKGLHTDADVDAVGIPILLRCESILRVSNRRVACPQCGEDFQLRPTWRDKQTEFTCPTCAWKVGWDEYKTSWRHRDLIGGGALAAFERFADQYPRARTRDGKMILVDQLLHDFHRDSKTRTPHRSASNNLVEGSLQQVVAFLDSITYDGGVNKDDWRADAAAADRKRNHQD